MSKTRGENKDELYLNRRAITITIGITFAAILIFVVTFTRKRSWQRRVANRVIQVESTRNLFCHMNL